MVYKVYKQGIWEEGVTHLTTHNDERGVAWRVISSIFSFVLDFCLT